MKKLKIVIFLIPLLLLAGCISNGQSGGGFDFNKIIRNPIVMVIVAAIAVWVAFKIKK